MTSTELMFEQGQSHWWPPRESIRFIGMSGGDSFEFFASPEAVESAAQLPTFPDSNEALTAFNAHDSMFFALAHKLWVQGGQVAGDYVITSEMVESHHS